MEDRKYYKLLEYLQGDKKKKGEDYIEWAGQFREEEGQIYKGKRRIVLRS